MINAVLIDDEEPAILEMEYLLKEYPQISIIGKYTNPLKAIEELAVKKPQVVFLDINMPQMNGMDVASAMLDKSPNSDIIFVTAYDKYAVEAFEIHALDYILKPVTEERFTKTISHVLKRGKNECRDDEKKLIITCFGEFQLARKDEEPIKWRSEKTKELFCFLLLNSNRQVSRDELIDTLWYDTDFNKAIHHLHNGIYYIRKSLRDYGIHASEIELTGSYRLKLGEALYDVAEFAKHVATADGVSSKTQFEQAVKLYKGDYMERADWLWAREERQRLIQAYTKTVLAYAETALKQGDYDDMETYLQAAYNKNPFDEDITVTILKMYKATGNKIGAAKHYRMFTTLLREELGVNPGEEVKRLCEKLE